MVAATLWRMDHTPLRLSRTQCGIGLSATPRLAPKEQRTHDAQPNPRMDNSGLREVIEEAGPQPGRLSFGAVAVWTFIGLVGLFMFSMSIPFFTGGFGPPQSSFSDLGVFSLIPIIICLVSLTVFIVGLRSIFKEIRNAQRLRTAWRNGWIEYRPALIGELVYLRSETEGSDDRKRTYFYYSAPLLILQPDGTLASAMSAEFRADNPNRLRSRGAALAEGARIATADTANNNGWTAAAYRADGMSSEAELSNGLTNRQVDAVHQIAEQSWVS